MNTISPVFIHQPDSCHGWGIEFNKERPFWEADATAFVRAMYDEMQSHDKSFSWFHQCGSGQEQNGNYYGYQFFEVCSKTEESDAKRMAEIIAEKRSFLLSCTQKPKLRDTTQIPETFGALLINAMCPRRESRWTS